MRAARFAALLATVAGSLALSAPTAASTFVVNSTLDLVDLAPGNGVCVTSGGTCTLRAAIQEANALAGADTIQLPVGQIELSIAGAGEDAAATGDLDILGETTIEGPALASSGAARAAVDANGLDRIFDIAAPAVSVTLRRLALQGGGVHGPGAVGGAVYVREQANVLIADSEIYYNDLWLVGPDPGHGIAVYQSGTLNLVRCLVWGNFETPPATGSASTIHSNGGLLGVYYSSIGNNGGAGIKAESGSTLILFGSTILNQLDYGLEHNGEASIARTTITNNYGGGIRDSAGALTTLVNSTVSANSSQGSGGGIAALGTWYLYSSTVVGNEADVDRNSIGDGGGIALIGDAEVHLANTLLAENRDSSPSGNVHPDCSGTLTSEGYNLIQYGTGCTIAGDTTGNINGAVPRIADLADNGGVIWTHALLADSPALDAGDPAGCTQVGGTAVVVDQRGYPRPIDGDQEPGAYCDIGAFERDHRTIFREGFECGGFLAWGVVVGRG